MGLQEFISPSGCRQEYYVLGYDINDPWNHIAKKMFVVDWPALETDVIQACGALIGQIL